MVQSEEMRKEKARAYSRVYYRANKEAVCRKEREWRQANPEAAAARDLRSKYKLCPEQIGQARLARKGGICESCGEFLSLVVDHNHQTGAFRGLICNPCNTTAGHMESQRSAAVRAYLDRKV